MERLRAVDGLAKKLPSGCLESPAAVEPAGEPEDDSAVDDPDEDAEAVLAGEKEGD